VGRRTTRRLGWLALCAAALAASLGPRGRAPAFDGAAFGRALEAQIAESKTALHGRVADLARLPQLAAAVSTDSLTVRDLTQEELAFRPQPDETIAIGQLPKLPKTGGSIAGQRSPVVLLVAPDGAAAPPLDVGPSHLVVSGRRLILSEAVQVIPRERADELDGVLAVGRPIDLRGPEAALFAAGARAELSAGDHVLALGPPAAEGAWRIAVPLADSSAGLRATVFATATRQPVTAWIVALALAGLALSLLLGGGRSAPRVAPAAASSATPVVWSPGSGSGPISLPPAVRSTPSGLPATPIGRIGRYDLLRTIGRGGMAQVYLGRATGEAGFTKLVALKVLQPELASQPQVVQHFLDEARLAAQIDHPNVVQTVDLGRSDDHYFIAMEYVDGADLSRLIEMSRTRGVDVPIIVALRLLRRICDGLQAAHGARDAEGLPLGLVHRDVKSANVFVARNGAVKVGDFGIAKASQASRLSRTEIGLVKGTPGYMAPEQRLAQTVDGRADLYGVGAIAYELLSGTPVNLDLAILAQKGRDGWPHLAPLSSMRTDVPPALEAIVMRALSYDPQDRFADCATLESALEGVAALCPPRAGSKTIAEWVGALLAWEAAAPRQTAANDV
jgi:tRNA A-37 threonylcarbamoyl transferase component Bud32